MFRLTRTVFVCILAMMIIFLPIKAWAMKYDIIILYTNDIHCAVDDNISLAQVAQYKQDLSHEITPYVALVDAGDAVQGAPLGKLSTGESIITVMNSTGYDFAIPGNHEFDYGMKRFFELANKLNCGYYSVNFLDAKTQKPLLPAYKIMQFGDTKIAFIGVTTPESLTSSTPAFFQDEDGKYIYTFCEDKSGNKLYAQIQRAVNEVKSQGADYVFLVAHLGLNGVSPQWSSGAVAKNTTGIDAIIDGHSHEQIVSDIVKNKQQKDVVITQTGTKLNTLGKLTINSAGSIKTELIRDLPAENPQVAEIIKQEKAKFAPILAQPIGKSQVHLLSTDSITGEQLVRKQETNMGDFVTDAYKSVLNTDIALCNGGGIRSEITPGVFSYNDILTAFPFGNMCVVIEATGQQILDALELGASKYPQPNGGFLQVAGLSYTIDSTIPSHVVLNEKGDFVKVDGAYRVKDVKIRGQSLDLNRKYTVGGTSYLLKLGGDGMTMFKNSRIIQDEVFSETDAIVEYVQNYLNADIGNGYEDVSGSGRIKIK